MSSTLSQVVLQAVPIITLEVLIPWAWEWLFYSNTTIDFAAWLLSVAFLDSAFPGSMPCFHSTRVMVRLWDILRLVSLWITFRLGLYLVHQSLLYMVKDYSKILCSVGLCWLRLIAPLVAILCFTAYLYFASEKKRNMALAAEMEQKYAAEKALQEAAEAELAMMPPGSSRRRHASGRQGVSRSSSVSMSRPRSGSSRRSTSKRRRNHDSQAQGRNNY